MMHKSSWDPLDACEFTPCPLFDVNIGLGCDAAPVNPLQARWEDWKVI